VALFYKASNNFYVGRHYKEGRFGQGRWVSVLTFIPISSQTWFITDHHVHFEAAFSLLNMILVVEKSKFEASRASPLKDSHPKERQNGKIFHKNHNAVRA